MKRPIVFISSTIYDFSDLRSALKYWLEEMGFNAQLSEYNDFRKNLNASSYEACLQSVSECDYFILLIGTRCGGMYPGENISITQKEYRVAYELAKVGKIKKLIIFIRQSVWDVKEDRKSLHKLLQDVTILENDKLKDTSKIENYNSSIVRNAEFIFNFIDEVTRKEEARNGNMPNMNWIHIFNTYEDILNTLKVELKANTMLATQIAEQNLKMALVYTLQKITHKTPSGKVVAFYMQFKEIREKLKKFRDTTENFSLEESIFLTTDEVDKMSNFLLFYYVGVDELNTYEFENILSSGVFMDFDIERGTPIYNNFCRMLHKLIEEINRAKRFVQDFPLKLQKKMCDNIRYYHTRPKQLYEFIFIDLAQLSSIYERLYNIQTISFYLIECMENHNKNLELPLLLNGLVPNERPLETDILNIFND